MSYEPRIRFICYCRNNTSNSLHILNELHCIALNREPRIRGWALPDVFFLWLMEARLYLRRSMNEEEEYRSSIQRLICWVVIWPTPEVIPKIQSIHDRDERILLNPISSIPFAVLLIFPLSLLRILNQLIRPVCRKGSPQSPPAKHSFQNPGSDTRNHRWKGQIQE